ncbi:MAG: NAD-dependent deacetylase [Candidatus Magnetoglobus multicellularis str. Araruama]|uniref:protein acetyllysine N-acetyltransferase n=1 Tax=Candidatus Magnetoglobus multicellularis str. Araruama TaxID=890399 RepID=A0A1V1PDR3_9BACT|nr:MAG: NAD-dependent deacetylase [Candidatus Magnetoglobus multicellularis str. Araruama]
MVSSIQKAAQDILQSKKVSALTGAGISVESGIPPFRGKGGLWESFDPMEYAHIDAFMRHPEKVWDVLLKGMKDIMDHAEPNDAHLGLAQLEQLGYLQTIITQNVDGLHQKAGNTDVIEFHGTFERNYCIDCNKQYILSEISVDQLPPKCTCGGIIRPDCVFFGEQIAYDSIARSLEIAQSCDTMLVIGTSAMVHPAAMIPDTAHSAGATVIEINPESTPLTGRISANILKGPAGQMMKQLINEIESIQENKT